VVGANAIVLEYELGGIDAFVAELFQLLADAEAGLLGAMNRLIPL
jgi:hypothetical protein